MKGSKVVLLHYEYKYISLNIKTLTKKIANER